MTPAFRYIFAAVSALAVYFLMPFGLVCTADAVHRMLCAALLACIDLHRPMPGNTELASFTNSMSIAVSLVIMLTLGLTFVLH